MPQSNNIILPIYKNRGELIQPTNIARLRASFKDNTGTLADLDTFPSVSIIQPSGAVSFGPSSSGVSRESVGKYLYEYSIGINGPLGVWIDVWRGTLNGFSIEASFNFIVAQGDLPAINSDGYFAIGDEVGFNYSQTSILNINKLLKTLKARLNSSGKSKKIINGNVAYVDCDIFSVDMLITFLASALTDFNQVPYFTYFTFDDTDIINEFHQILVEGATLQSLASKALIERGREFQISDNGVQFTPPTVSEMLNSQYGTLLTHYFEKLKYIKNSMRPGPRSLGTFRPLAASPQILQMRHRRQGRLF